jgi:HD superfamily phosphohydrolase
MKTLTGLDAEKHILDPIHGPIPITSVELAIISNPIFQRLRNITQLGIASLVFPGATHNRFMHSIGTLYVMDNLLYNLRLQGMISIKEDDCIRVIQLMRLAALLHDCGHLPFSHIFENKYEGTGHEYFSRCIIEKSQLKDILNDYSIKPESIGALIQGNIPIRDENSKDLTELIPLLHSDADADRMDYLLRDAYFTGVPYGKIDLNRIFNFITKKNGYICFHEKSQGALEDFLYSRYQMYKTVYIHKTVVCYELLLHKIYKIFEKYTEKGDLFFVLPKVSQYESSNKGFFEEDLYYLTEGNFFNTVRSLLLSNKVITEDKDQLERLYSRILTRCAIKNCFRFDDLAEIEKTEYCEKEEILFTELKKFPNIVDHWSFLRHDPSKPIRIATPIRKQIEDEQDFTYIRILKRNHDVSNELILLQNRTNSIIQSLARHHRILISYYHEDENSQMKIQELANKFITQP